MTCFAILLPILAVDFSADRVRAERAGRRPAPRPSAYRPCFGAALGVFFVVFLLGLLFTRPTSLHDESAEHGERVGDASPLPVPASYRPCLGAALGDFFIVFLLGLLFTRPTSLPVDGWSSLVHSIWSTSDRSQSLVSSKVSPGS